MYIKKGGITFSVEYSNPPGINVSKDNKKKIKQKSKDLDLGLGIVYSSKDVKDGQSYKNKSLLGLLHSYKYFKGPNKKELKLTGGLLYSSKDVKDGQSYESSSLLGLLHSCEYNKKDDYSYKRFTPFFAVEKKDKEKHFRLLHFIKIPLGSE